MKKSILLLFSILMLSSCNKFQEHVTTDFQDNRWISDKWQDYTVVIPADQKAATVNVFFSHIYEPGYDEIPVSVKIKSPDGKDETINTKILLKDKNGKNLSDCAGDVCDCITTIKTDFPLKKGTYIFSLKNNVKQPFLPNALVAGIKINA
ncbi:lipoprotein [Flavobacterium sp. RNTU_13]|uniref:lipoprotein n=1 Tax=Flavobacterium sp. RNTU_13 TaxID=3375145 RepID=UPI003985FAC4